MTPRGRLVAVTGTREMRDIPRWESRVYASRYSRRVTGRLTVQARTRRDALDMLARLCSASGAAGAHARAAVSGLVRHTLHAGSHNMTWAAPDGTWRQLDLHPSVEDVEAGRLGRIYARWETYGEKVAS